MNHYNILRSSVMHPRWNEPYIDIPVWFQTKHQLSVELRQSALQLSCIGIVLQNTIKQQVFK